MNAVQLFAIIYSYELLQDCLNFHEHNVTLHHQGSRVHDTISAVNIHWVMSAAVCLLCAEIHRAGRLAFAARPGDHNLQALFRHCLLQDLLCCCLL